MSWIPLVSPNMTQQALVNVIYYYFNQFCSGSVLSCAGILGSMDNYQPMMKNYNGNVHDLGIVL